MSGHSKWSQIKRKKGATDVKRGQIFSKLSRQLTVASRLGSGLELAISAARAANMPKETIDRAIAKGQGSGADMQIEEALYEAYGPGGVGLLITVVTDNKNRTLGELRAIYNKLGGRPAESGSVRFLFDHRAIFEVAAGTFGNTRPVVHSPSDQAIHSASVAGRVKENAPTSADEVSLAFIETGVDDVQIDDDRVIGYGAPDQFTAIKASIESQGLTLLETRLAWVPKVLHTVDAVNRDSLIRLMEAIDDLDDVTSVETNADL